MSEHNLDITIGSEPFEMRRDNTSLFTHLGELAMYDHVFFVRNEEEDGFRGTYLFRQAQGFKEIVEFMAEHEYPAHLNMLEVSDSDRQAWENFMYKDLRSLDSLPDEWDDGNAA